MTNSIVGKTVSFLDNRSIPFKKAEALVVDCQLRQGDKALFYLLLELPDGSLTRAEARSCTVVRDAGTVRPC